MADGGLPGGRPKISGRGAMKRVTIAWCGLALVLLAATAGLCYYGVYWRPHQKRTFDDMAWWKVATVEDQRILCHRIITHGIGGPHDAFLHLSSIGDKESVPILISSLRRRVRPDQDELECTDLHCIEALRSLTGEDYGADYRKWEQWWRSTGRNLPNENFHSRPAPNESKAPSNPPPSAGATSPAPQ